MNAPALVWADECGWAVCNPVARNHGIKYELYNNRVGKAFALLYVGSKGTEIVIPAQNRAIAMDKCEALNQAVSSAIQSQCAWVKCSERLPEMDSEVLCVHAGGLIATMYYKTQNQAFEMYDSQGWQEMIVTHWQPLPALPSQGER